MKSDPACFATRRANLSARIGSGIAIIAAASESTRNDDVNYPFRQDSDFWYLTGFEEPDSIAVLDPSHPEEKYVLFVRPRDREMELWNGYRAGVHGAIDKYAADAAYPLDKFSEIVKPRLVGRSSVYTQLKNRTFSDRMVNLIVGIRGIGNRFGRPVPDQLRDATLLLDEMRLFKSESDAKLLQIASNISMEGHAEAMRFCRPGLSEYQVEAAMEYVFRINGSRRNGYSSIVAGGANACVLHYTKNDTTLQQNDLVLIDAGAEYEYFSADITRTFPVGGKFTQPQRAIYDLVLSAHQAAIQASTIGSSMLATHQTTVEVLTAGLIELGLLPGSFDDSLARNHHLEFFMHGTGHWLGHDVHDSGAYGIGGKPRPLEPGMCFTVEPGIYVAPDTDVIKLSNLEYDQHEWTERRMLLGAAAAKKMETEERQAAGYMEHPIPAEMRGIGIRIEDDILLTSTGQVNLTANLPTSADDVEALCAEMPTVGTALV